MSMNLRDTEPTLVDHETSGVGNQGHLTEGLTSSLPSANKIENEVEAKGSSFIDSVKDTFSGSSSAEKTASSLKDQVNDTLSHGTTEPYARNDPDKMVDRVEQTFNVSSEFPFSSNHLEFFSFFPFFSSLFVSAFCFLFKLLSHFLLLHLAILFFFPHYPDKKYHGYELDAMYLGANIRSAHLVYR
ncbi:hypothetical protein BCR39DRAFT_549825 [Naematelia encephala]|uniref:Uncharacterized protein n=1 Tax=Naematelia encephala TaxID=71784 RepID=A0A1Y2AKX7_9TREE|nr:hypothetical protein BCR39DRAFT_549825 [Naematelia encephala]